MKTSAYIKKFSNMFFGDESIIAQRRYFDGEISELEYELACNAVLNDLYRLMLGIR